MAPDTNHAAATDAYSLVVRAEVASELLNSARARLMERIYEIEGQHGTARSGEAGCLEACERELFALQRSLDYRDNSHVEAVIARIGPLLKDEARFWAEMSPGI